MACSCYKKPSGAKKGTKSGSKAVPISIKVARSGKKKSR